LQPLFREWRFLSSGHPPPKAELYSDPITGGIAFLPGPIHTYTLQDPAAWQWPLICG